MRIYRDYPEAFGEIKRDLAEMGIRYQSQTYQDKDVHDNPDFETMEIQNYIYCVLNPDLKMLNPTQPWADAEFEERVSGRPLNPGRAWFYRKEIWEPFLIQCPQGDKFGYTYAERIGGQLKELVEEAIYHPDSRQLWLSIWDPRVDVYLLGGQSRVPCSLGYLFQIREGKVNMTYMMRSCDFATHFENDVYLATKLLHWFAAQVGKPVGTFTHYIASLHIFQKDVEGVF